MVAKWDIVIVRKKAGTKRTFLKEFVHSQFSFTQNNA